MKKLFALIAIITMALSCTKQKSGGYIGSWEFSLIAGQSSLMNITGVDISDKTVTIHYKDGTSNTVNSTYIKDDTDIDGNACEGFVFDEPLYQVKYSGLPANQVSHVVLEQVPVLGLTWGDYGLTHSFMMTRK